MAFKMSCFSSSSLWDQYRLVLFIFIHESFFMIYAFQVLINVLVEWTNQQALKSCLVEFMQLPLKLFFLQSSRDQIRCRLMSRFKRPYQMLSNFIISSTHSFQRKISLPLCFPSSILSELHFFLRMMCRMVFKMRFII